jgi:hypothetical protein
LNQNGKETSDRIAHLAAVVLARHSLFHLEKELAGSALAQHHTSKQTSAAIGSLAAWQQKYWPTTTPVWKRKN